MPLKTTDSSKPQGEKGLKQKHLYRIKKKVSKVLSSGEWLAECLQARGGREGGKITSNLAKAKLVRRRRRQNRDVIIQMKRFGTTSNYESQSHRDSGVVFNLA